ncbi:MAG: J domain-containing protein [Methylibium sp.]|uniref:J domain-containing protein n=1 Tax=Methylibium sp. TaxID=2067992 RepID=UPI0017C53207|nr:J domain-containing protein [Methylibium sp.]MBA3596884.1 J domain-containing protein [Methylibium sp.]
MNRPKVATYYSRLKVAHDAPPEVVRAAYKALVQKYHPDRHQGSLRHQLVLAALNKAHEVLSDPARRAGHDQWIREEEVRLGWREPSGDFRLGLGLRMELVMSSLRHDGLPLSEALCMHLTRGQRAALWLGLGATLVLLAGGAMSYFRNDDDPFRRLGPLPPLAPFSPAPPSTPSPVAYSASSPP